MGLFNRKKWRRIGRLLPTVLALLLVAVIVFGVLYVRDYYHADTDAIEAFAEGTPVSITKQADGTMVFMPETARAGLIFYPGAKVEYSAYAPLMQRLAENGIACFLVKMPANLAVLDANAADGITEQFPEIEDWYIGGHSLGGTMASSYVSDKENYKGLVLLASFSTTYISTKDIDVISIYGTNDGVLEMDKYAQNKVNLPSDLVEVPIEGGNHAFFGMYGEQKGDGVATITNVEQIELAATAINDFIK